MPLPAGMPLARIDIILYFCGTQAYPAFYNIHFHSCSLLDVSWVIMCFLRTELRTSLSFEFPGPKCLLIHSFDVWSVFVQQHLDCKGTGTCTSPGLKSVGTFDTINRKQRGNLNQVGGPCIFSFIQVPHHHDLQRTLS